MEYSIIQYHTASVPGPGLLCQNPLTDQYQQPTPAMDAYQPLSEATPWSFSCLSPTQFAIQNGNVPPEAYHPAMDVKDVSILSPMTATDFELTDEVAHPGPYPSSPPDIKPMLTADPPVRDWPAQTPSTAASPPPKARRASARNRRAPKTHPIAIAIANSTSSGTPPGTSTTTTTPYSSSTPPRRPSTPPSPTAMAAAVLAATTARKAGHSAVERKYREGMNGAMNRLRAIIPFARRADAGDKYVGPRRLPSKAAVLHRAVDEIVELRTGCARAERRARALAADRDRWKRKAEALWQAEGRADEEYEDEGEEGEEEDYYDEDEGVD
jgi:hypothetical protein